MHHPVMSGAEKDEVLQLIAAAVHHVDEVVPIAVGCSPFTPRPLAMPVASIQRPPLGSTDRRLGATDVDDDRVLEQDPSQAGVAGPALHRLG